MARACCLSSTTAAVFILPLRCPRHCRCQPRRTLPSKQTTEIALWMTKARLCAWSRSVRKPNVVSEPPWRWTCRECHVQPAWPRRVLALPP